MTASETTEGGRFRVLHNGDQMPSLGFGVWQVPDGTECFDAVLSALELGYRHIDTAQVYRNEESVGRALRESRVPREQVFVTTKFFPGGEDPASEAEQSLGRLGLDYVDLYLIHWPAGGATWAWPGMERAHELGYARSIGISNFSVEDLQALLAIATVVPAVNQVQISPFQYRSALIEACERESVAVEAYSPLGTGRHIVNETVSLVARRVGRTPAQVLLRWCLQHDLVPIAKSTHRGRIEENIQIFDFSLSSQDMADLDACDETGGTDRALEKAWW